MASALESSWRQATPDARAALGSALSAYFASRRLAALSRALARRSSLPGLLLWVHALHPLPGLVSWMGMLAWSGCSALALSFLVLAWRWDEKLRAAIPQAERAARLQFAPARRPAPSSALFYLLAAAGALLGLHVLLPHLLSSDLLWWEVRGWPVLFGLSAAARALESAL